MNEQQISVIQSEIDTLIAQKTSCETEAQRVAESIQQANQGLAVYGQEIQSLHARIERLQSLLPAAPENPAPAKRTARTRK